jgi:hypothetical protein
MQFNDSIYVVKILNVSEQSCTQAFILVEKLQTKNVKLKYNKETK